MSRENGRTGVGARALAAGPKLRKVELEHRLRRAPPARLHDKKAAVPAFQTIVAVLSKRGQTGDHTTGSDKPR